jgi:hypothetical protein
MGSSLKIQIEKISNGYLFTETLDESEGIKTFDQEKNNFFDLLKNSKSVGELISNDDDALLLEIIRHDLKIVPIHKTNHELLNEIVQRDVYSPFKTKVIDEDKLRLSVTKANAYSAARLMQIDFLELDKQASLTIARKSEICGVHKGTFYSTWSKVSKGIAVFQSPETRVAMTVLAKYYEAVLGIRTSKKDELDKLKAGIEEEIANLEVIFEKRALVHSNNVEPIIFALKKLINLENNQ